jgi:putative photosynthetic complex assembly protein
MKFQNIKSESGMTATSFSKTAGFFLVLVVIATVAGVAYLKASGSSAEVVPFSAIIEQRALRFLDADRGDVAVFDYQSGKQIATVTGQAGFVRGALRALVRERRLAGEGSDKPFNLIAYQDGRLTLEDTVSAQRIDLGSFGPENAANFASFLKL